jgi:CRP/FNR family cyclic AMP-dependent transcriptional regulator
MQSIQPVSYSSNIGILGFRREFSMQPNQPINPSTIQLMFDQIDQYVARCLDLREEELAFFHSILKPVSLRKKDWLLREGEIGEYEAFVVKGCLRKYCIDDDGSEIVLQFAVEDWWIGDMDSFVQQIPSQVNIQALEDSELLLIHHDDKEHLFQKVPAFERMFRLMVQRSLVVLQDRFVATLAQPADIRYQAFIEKYPDIVRRVPQHYIASYLGISPEFLSRVRARMAKKA